MSKLTKTQALVLSRAAQNADRIALPLPDHLHGAVANKVVGMLVDRGLLDEVDANLRRGDPLWRETGDGHGTTFVITNAGLEIMGAEPKFEGPTQEKMTVDGARQTNVKSKAKTPRSPTKQDTLIEMLRRPKGVSLEEITTVFGWQRHTARGAISNLCRKHPDLSISSENLDGQGCVYKISRADASA